jgi:hypothetical protein
MVNFRLNPFEPSLDSVNPPKYVYYLYENKIASTISGNVFNFPRYPTKGIVYTK